MRRAFEAGGATNTVCNSPWSVPGMTGIAEHPLKNVELVSHGRARGRVPSPPGPSKSYAYCRPTPPK